jgi:hypothetical protein
MPLVDVITQLGKSSWFIALDLQSSFLQNLDGTRKYEKNNLDH